MEEKVTTVVPKGMEVVKPIEGVLTSDQRKALIMNFLDFTVPMYLGLLFAQLALGVDWKIAFGSSLVAMYGPLRDYFKKKQSDTPYLRDK